MLQLYRSDKRRLQCACLGDRVCFSSGPRLLPVLPEPGIPTEDVILLGPLSQGPSLTAVPCLPYLLFNLEDLGYSVIIRWWLGVKILEICICMRLKGECSSQS